MLIDLRWDFNNSSDKPFWYQQRGDLIVRETNPEACKKAGTDLAEMPPRVVLIRHLPGIYECGGIPGLEALIKEGTDCKIINRWTNLYGEAGYYGVADTVEQVLEAARKHVDHERHIPGIIFENIDDLEKSFLIRYTNIKKEENPGWRWHKNGTYIGNQEPTMEHLGDEQLIEQIISYHIYQITVK
jgi:hypothetical protein